MKEKERLESLKAVGDLQQLAFEGKEGGATFCLKASMLVPIVEQELSDVLIKHSPAALCLNLEKPQPQASDIMTAICILANRGSLKVFNRDLAELKAIIGVNMSELCSLALAGCETKDDVALVRCVSEPLKAEISEDDNQ